MGGSSKAQIVGYEYSMGVQLTLCNGPIDEISELIVGERQAWVGSVTSNATVPIDKPGLFGGKSREGGLVGSIDFCFGEQNQQKNPYLASLLNPVPAYRGLVTAVFRGNPSGGFTWSSGNPYFKAPWLRMRRVLKGWTGDVWYPEKARIGALDMNGAHIIYEALTNTEWGLGYPVADMDDPWFRNSADILHAENFGLSLMWMEQTTINDFVQMIVNHIDGVLLTDVRTGKFKLKLIRNDYDVASLPTLDEDNILELTSFQRVAWGEASNEIVVKYTDRDQNETSVSLQDLASIQAQGRVISATREYVAVRDADLAARLGQRDLNVTSSPLSKITLICTRVAWDWDMADVFRLVWPRLGIAGVPYRIIKIDKGDLINGQITIEAIEDVFGMPLNAYVDTQPQGWVDTVREPVPVTAARAFEAPYYDIVQAFSAADIAFFPPGYAYGEVAALRPTRSTYGYDLWGANPGAAYSQLGTGEFTPTGTLPTALAQSGEQVTFELNGAFDLSGALIGTYAYIDNEAIKILDVNPASGAITFLRGTLDTVPVAHAAGSRVWFLDDLGGYDEVQRTSGESVNYRILPRTGLGTLALARAADLPITFMGRADKPYPPGNVRINGQYFPARVTGGFTVDWSHRDRIQQTAGLIDFKTGSIGPEAGTTYTVLVYSGASLKRTYLGIPGTQWSYPMADAIADGTISNLRLQVYSVRGTTESWQRQDVTTQRVGFGFRFGEQFGGII